MSPTEPSAAKKAKLDEATSQAANVITADPTVRPTGKDSGYSDSETTDVLPSIRDHVFELGRRWHRYRAGAYPFPNDAAEQEREQVKHLATVTLCADQLHLCPLRPDPQNILDVGTGTGIWAIESASFSFPLRPRLPPHTPLTPLNRWLCHLPAACG
jgi:hypothetical protein